MTAQTITIEPLEGSEWRYSLNDKRAYLLDRTRHRARAWVVVEGTSTGFDAGTCYHASKDAAEAHISTYLAGC